MSFDPLAFFGGAAKEQTKIWDEQDKKRDAYKEKMEALYTKGMEERQKEYDTQAKAYQRVKQLKTDGDLEGAWTVYAGMHSDLQAKTAKDTLGKEYWVNFKDNKDVIQSRLDAAIKTFESRNRPSLDLDNMVVDREKYFWGKEEEYKQHIRDMYNLDPQEEGIIYNSKVKGSVLEPKPDDGGDAWQSKTATVAGTDGSETLVPYQQNKNTGELRYPPGSGPRGILKEQGPANRELKEGEKAQINSTAKRILTQLEKDKSIDANVREGVVELAKEKNNPVTAAIAAEARRLVVSSDMSADEAAQRATDIMILAAKNGALQKDDGFFGDYYWTGKVKMITPEGQAMAVPMYKMQRMLENNWTLENE